MCIACVERAFFYLFSIPMNRTLLRIKALQALFSLIFGTTEGSTTELILKTEKRINDDIKQGLILYYLLLDIVIKAHDNITKLNQVYNNNASINSQNKVITLLKQCENLQEGLKAKKHYLFWNEYDNYPSHIAHKSYKDPKLYQGSDNDKLVHLFTTYIAPHAPLHELYQTHNFIIDEADDLLSFVHTACYTTLIKLNEKNQKDTVLLQSLKTKEDKRFLSKLIHDTYLNFLDLKEEIDSRLTDWSFERLTHTDQLLLCMGAYEIKHMPGIPPQVSITEYTHISTLYSSPESYSLINGVLERVASIRGMTSVE